MKLSDFVFQYIAAHGVKHVFMFPGGGAMHLVDSLGRCKDIEYICNLHEQACAIAAEAYARVNNKLGVALVTTGPGGTNAITGVAGAWLDSTPCLFISGQVKRTDLMGDLGVRQLGVQEIDIVSLVRPITKYAVTIMEPSSIRYHLEKALYFAKAGRPGPVWLDIPLDVQAASIEPEMLDGFDLKEMDIQFDRYILEKQVSDVVDLINMSERPVILAGNGIRLAGAEKEFLDLANHLNIPLLTTWLGIDLLPESHKLFMGRPGSIAPRGANFTLQNSDCLLIIGSRLDMALTGYAHDKFARAAKKIMVDIDANEIRKVNASIDIQLCADAGVFIHELFKSIDKINAKPSSNWLARCQGWKEKYPVVLTEHRMHRGSVSTYFFSEILADELSNDDLIVPGSSGNCVEIFLLAFKVKSGQRVFHNRGLGAMGFGLPASIGACIASGRRRTICVDGDGGFQLNIQELETVARLKLPIKFFVINNKGYASIRAMQMNYFQQLVGADSGSGLTLPDIIKLAMAYGLSTMRIVDQHDLRTQIRDVLKLPGPVICEIMAVPDEIRAPRLSSAQRSDGTMISKPLEDLWPFLDRQEFLSNMLIQPLDE
ncbi:MAG: thiamine pyrophosphate-binding protein [Syntrophales bacterium]